MCIRDLQINILNKMFNALIYGTLRNRTCKIIDICKSIFNILKIKLKFPTLNYCHSYVSVTNVTVT